MICQCQATVAAFAASEGQGHPRIVDIEKVHVIICHDDTLSGSNPVIIVH